MPGIFGFTPSKLPISDTGADLQKMQDSLIYRPHHQSTGIFTDDYIAAGCVRILPGAERQQPCLLDDLCIWIDGEFYPSSSAQAPPFAEIIAEQSRQNRLRQFFETVDGIFTVVIYNRNNHELLLVNDRYGLRHCYVAQNRNMTAWSSEIKAFAHVPGMSLNLRPSAVDEFLVSGHFVGDATWFNEVSLLPPASFVNIRLADGATVFERYRKIENTTIHRSIASLDKEARHLGALFKTAVEKRCAPGERIGLGLSGGLDSRALFAAVPTYVTPLPVVTFGRAGCADITIAEKVSRLRKSTHVIHEINAGNWLDHRCEGIWITDGQISMLHLHGIESIDNYRNLYDVELNGFLGDALLGGSYGNAREGELTRFLNRGRRLIATALVTGNLSYITRLPFFDNDFFDAYMSLPLTYRRGSRIYNTMLLSTFPDYYTSIPWQKTGLPISQSGVANDILRFSLKVRRKLVAAITGRNRADYFDYASWIREKPAADFFVTVLNSSDLMLATHIDRKIIRKEFDAHFSGCDRSEILCKYATVEIWLRQFYKKELLRQNISHRTTD